MDHLQEDISGIPRQFVRTEVRSNQPIVSCKTETAKNVINFIGMYLERSPFKENCKPSCQKMHCKGHHHCFFSREDISVNFTKDIASFHKHIHSQMLFKIDDLENFAKFKRKHLCWSL